RRLRVRALSRPHGHGSLPGGVRAHQPPHRARADRGAARERRPGGDRCLAAARRETVANRRGLRIALVTGGLGAALLVAVALIARRGSGLAPDFAVTDLSGRTVRLSALRGKIVLLNVWTTWCAPCVEEMPSMERLWANLEKDDFALLAVSQDEEGRR